MESSINLGDTILRILLFAAICKIVACHSIDVAELRSDHWNLPICSCQETPSSYLIASFWKLSDGKFRAIPDQTPETGSFQTHSIYGVSECF